MVDRMFAGEDIFDPDWGADYGEIAARLTSVPAAARVIISKKRRYQEFSIIINDSHI
jgi:hypothetical protein